MALTELMMIAAYTVSAVMIPLMAIQADRDSRSK